MSTFPRHALRARVAVAVCLSIALSAVLVGANVAPASATHGALYHTEGDMVRDPSLARRASFVTDPGTGHLLNRHQLHDRRDLYNHYGFSNNFVWYSHEVERVVDSSQRWTFCDDNSHAPGTPCPITGVRGLGSSGNTVGGTFGGDTRLHLFEFEGGFIGRACGNFSPAGGPHPVPTITGTKFDDRNGDGVRNGDEPPVPGWRMVLSRAGSVVDQPLGEVLATTTDGNGFYRFELDGHLPGTYVVTEGSRDGWVATTPASRVVEVREGIGRAELGGNDFGNRREADTEKLDFRLVDAPTEIDADRTTELLVDAVVVNNGPMPEIDAEDTLEVTGPVDCMVTPPRQSQRRTLRRGEPVTITFRLGVLCTEPSNHTFAFVDRLELQSEGVTERAPANNIRHFDHTIPVIDYADLRIEALRLDCPQRIDVNTPFTCAGTADVANDGPYQTPNGDVSLTPSVPGDCAAAPVVRHEDVLVPLGQTVTLAGTWTMSCATRSFHPFGLAASVALDHEHVRDLGPANDTAITGDTVEVFESADLQVIEPLRIACGERRVGPSQFACTIGVLVENDGPATAVATRLDVTLSGPADCTVVPTGAHTERFSLDAGAQRAFSEQWDVSCAAPTRHTFLAIAHIRTDEPHAEDRILGNNTAHVRWVPMDVKPGSDPSSVNVGKRGTLPFAILSTPDFDAPRDVVVASLLAGQTGYEDSVLGCKAEPEDVNGDSFGDLVCHADTQLAGLLCGDTTMTLTGRLVDGTPIESQDSVKVTGCS